MKPAPAVGLLCALAALATDVGELVTLYDAATLPPWLGHGLTRHATSLAKVIALAILVRGYREQDNLSSSLKLLAMSLTLSLGLAIAGPEGPGLVTRVALLFFLWVLVAAVWIHAGRALAHAEPASFRGYNQPLSLGALLIGGAMLAYFFDAPRVAGHILFDLSLAGLATASISPAWMLSIRGRYGLYVVTLILPAALYAAPFLNLLGSLFYENRERLATIGAESADVTTMSSWDDLVEHGLTDFVERGRVPVFEDIWLFDDGRALAIRGAALFERPAPNAEWTRLRSLGFSAKYIHFDTGGERGVVGAGFHDPLATTDGGRAWAMVETEAIFSSHSGRAFGDKMLDDSSPVFLDPESGRGSFMMGCRFFTTVDFAATWEMLTLVDEDGETRCPSDSPFAVDSRNGLAMASVMGETFLMRRPSPGERWKEDCVLDVGAALVLGDDWEFCEETPPEDRAAFLSRIDRDWEILSRQLPDASDVETLIKAGLDAATLAIARRSTTHHTWFSGAGYLVLEGTDGLEIEYLVPPLHSIAPADDRNALGIVDGDVYATKNGGRIWRRIDDETNIYMELVHEVPLTGDAYIVGEGELFRWRSGQAQPVAKLPDDFEVRVARSSPDGEEVLLASGETILWSSDGGENWRVLSIPLPPEAADEIDKDDEDGEDGDFWQPSLVALECALRGEHRCVAGFDDGTAFTFALDRPELTAPLPALPLEDGYADGLLVALGDEPIYFYLPYETSQLLVYEPATWQQQRIGIVVGPGDFLDVAEDGGRFALQQGSGTLLIVDADGSHRLFEETDWDDGYDELYAGRLCWSGSGDLALLTHAESRVAISKDGGGAWAQASAGTATGSACGLSGDWLWLLGDGLTVYQRDR